MGGGVADVFGEVPEFLRLFLADVRVEGGHDEDVGEGWAHEEEEEGGVEFEVGEGDGALIFVYSETAVCELFFVKHD